MVEAYANSVEDKLIDGLSFKLESGASYINERKFVTFHPQGSNIYSPSSGSKLIRISLQGQNWLDPSTFRVAFDVVNDALAGTAPLDPYLRPLSPWGMFRRVRLLCGSQLVEDIDYYGRVHEMMSILSAKHSRANESVEGFGFVWDEHMTDVNKQLYKGIAPGSSAVGASRPGDRQTVMFKPLLGLLNQPRYLPLEYLNSLVIELELVDKAEDAVVTTDGTTFTADNNSVKWHLENVQVKCDVISLDSSVNESYHQVLLSTKEIPIHYNTLNSQFQTITNNSEPFINVSRAATRLKSVFVTLDKNITGTRITAGRKWWNDFFSPGSENNRDPATGFRHSNNDEFELAIQIGSKTFPDGNPIRSHAEAYYQLRKTLGVQSSNVHSFDVSAKQYHDNRLIMAIDTEKSLGASFIGLNTRSGDLMSVRFKYRDASDPDRLADRMHIVLHTDNIMQIHLTGVTIYD